MRKIAIRLILLAFCLVGLVGCTNTSVDAEQKVLEASNAIVFQKFQTVDFELPSTLKGGVTATWVSNNTDVIRIVTRKGVVYADTINPEKNTEVELVATLSWGSCVKEFSYRVVVQHRDINEVKNIKDILDGKYESNATIIVQGTINAVSEYSESYKNFNVLIEDETAAVYLYRIKADSKEAYEEYKVGSLVEVEATYSPYSGLHELASCTVTFLDYDENYKTNVIELNEIPEDWSSYQSRVVRLNLTYVSGDIANKTTSTFKDANGKEVPLYPNSDWGTLEDITLVSGQEVVVTAFVNWYNKAQLTQVPGLDYIKIGEQSEEQKVETIKKNIEKAVSSKVDADFVLPETVSDVNVSWTLTETTNATLSGLNVTVVRPALGENDATIELNYEFTFNNTKYTGKVNVVVSAIQPEILAISEVYKLAKGDKVTVKGTVIGVNTNKTGLPILIDDGTQAIMVFGYDDPTNYTVGQEVLVSGELDIYNGLYEIKNPTVEVTGSKTASVVTLDKAPTDWLSYQNKVVSIELTYTNGKYVDSEGTEVTLFATNKNWKADLLTLNEGEVVVVTGFVNWFNKAQLSPVADKDFMVKKEEVVERDYTLVSEIANLEANTEVTLQGVVSNYNSAWNSKYSNMSVYLTDESGTILLYRLKTNVTVGQVIRVVGQVSLNSNDNTVKEISNGTATVVKEAPQTEVNTISAALSASCGVKAVITGEVSEIYSSWDSTYNNMSVYITDGENKILVFRLTTEVKVGDKVTVTGYVGSHNGVNQIVQGATATIEANGGNGNTGTDTPVTDTNKLEDLVFTNLANKASGDTYLTTNFPNWTITGKLGNGYGGYLGFGRSGDKTSAITSNTFSTETEFDVKVVLKGNGSDGVMTSTLTFELVDKNGNVVATGYAEGATEASICPIDQKDTTYTISFTFAEGKTIVDATNLKISFAKETGNIGFKSLTVVTK